MSLCKSAQRPCRCAAKVMRMFVNECKDMPSPCERLSIVAHSVSVDEALVDAYKKWSSMFFFSRRAVCSSKHNLANKTI